jgi:hypothetical protein
MSFVPADPEYERRTRDSFARQGAMAYLGAVLEKVEPGRVEISLAFRPEFRSSTASSTRESSPRSPTAPAATRVSRSSPRKPAC